MLGRGTDVERRLVSFCPARRKLRKEVVTQVDQPLAEILDLDSREGGWLRLAADRDLQPRGFRLDEIDNLLNILWAALVHRNVGILEPALLLQVRGEVDEERSPVVLELRRAGQKLLPALNVRPHTIGYFHIFIFAQFHIFTFLLLPRDIVLPRTHRVARDVGAKSTLPPELDILVEYLVVEDPCAVRLPYAADHRVVAVVALVVPGEIQERHGKRLAAAVGERAPYRLHLGVVLLREWLHIEVARNSPRMLPEVEEVFPFLRRRQNAI